MEISLSGDDWTLTGWHHLQWHVHSSMELGSSFHAPVPCIKAVVPGAVQQDLMAAGWLSNPNEGLNSLNHEWVNHRDWVFEKSFEVSEEWLQDRCELIFDGLDDVGEIYLNGVKLADFEGMFKPIRLDVTGLIRNRDEGVNRLLVAFFPSREVYGQYGYSNRIEVLKSRFNYGWDWCPRIVPVGIWQSVRLLTYRGLKITDFYPDASLENDLTIGHVHFKTEIEVLSPGCFTFEYKVMNSDGQTIYINQSSAALRAGRTMLEQHISLADVKPWWPNGYGEHPVYSTILTVWDAEGRTCDVRTRSIGFRNIKFIQNEQAPAGSLPYTLLLNGKRIFMKGVNWVPINPYYGGVSQSDYERYLSRFKAMNVNVLRVWGGGITEKEPFYDYCNQNGLMVWQEFLQSSSGINNCPPDSAVFLKQLEEVSRIAIIEKRAHPSLIIWCGGNELMWDNFRPVNENHSNIALLKRIVDELDPHKYFLPASASGPRFTASEDEFGLGVHHDVHGPWVYSGEESHYRYFNGDDALFRSESGTPGTSRVEMIRKWAGKQSCWPPTKDNPYWNHRGSWWLQWDQLTELFGSWDKENEELDAYCQASRYLQMESLRYMAESVRRREPQSSGFIVWMGNEPFANNANTSLIEFDGVPKPAYYALKKAFAKFHVSASYERLTYKTGERFSASVYVHDEEGLQECTVTCRIYSADGMLLLERVFESDLLTVVNKIGSIEWDVKPLEHSLFIVSLTTTSRGGVVADNRYLFTIDAIAPLAPLRSLPQAKIRLLKKDEGIVLVNDSHICAVGLMLIERDAGRMLQLDRNDLILMPGEQQAVRCAQGSLEQQDLYMEGLNIR
ncbi:glycoside hydrolase family 2 TIM barrel-domain containing protein [Cohnella sp. WQ 127256]|uniref:glycoside hydrolase family 2 protein n=1 Tax=Cohnella sp. WQ 127256 TaxID=2938790 RepID=UPI002117C763